jgi:hypothetical protein
MTIATLLRGRVARSGACHTDGMESTGRRWSEVERLAGELALGVAARLRAHEHHVIATVRDDGRPRVSGTTVNLTDGRLWLGMMGVAARARDLRTRPWCALHSAPLNVTLPHGEGDVRIDADAVFLDDADFASLLRAIGHEPESFDGSSAVELMVREMSLVEVVGDEMLITSWSPSAGVRTGRHR